MVSRSATTVDVCPARLPLERRDGTIAIRQIGLKTRTRGYVEGMDYGMIYYPIPLSRFSETHNGHPLCYVGLAALKSHCAIKTLDDLALSAIAESIVSMSVDGYIALYERSRLRTKVGARKVSAKTIRAQ